MKTNRVASGVLLVCLFAFSSPWAYAEEAGAKEAFVLPGDVIVPQIATGGDGTFGIFMTFQLVNFTNNAASVQISFFDSSGNPMVIDFEQDGQAGSASFMSAALGAKGSSLARTFPSGATQIGYARVLSQPANSVAVSATFNQAVPDRPLFQSFIPLTSGLHESFMVPVLNAGPFTGSVAVVSQVAQTVTLTVRDFSGVSLCSTTRAFAVGEHIAQIVTNIPGLECAAGRDSMLEIQGPSGSVAGIGITAEDSGAFSTQPVYGPVPTP